MKEPPFPPIPELPPEIYDAIDSGNLILFVGAGVSRLIGYPLWGELACKLADLAVKDQIMGLSDKEILLSSGFSPMQIITILAGKFDEKNPGDGVRRIATELSDVKMKEPLLAKEIADYLAAYNALIVTTNADLSLDKAGPLTDRLFLKKLEDYGPPYNQNAIIHLHGSTEDPSSMIFTSQQYASHYKYDSNFGKKLTELFDNSKTVLFIGYGVNEFELIRYFMQDPGSGIRKRFLLEGYLDKDEIKRKFDEEYYLSLGIHLLPYSREKEDYRALVSVLKAWDEKVKTQTLAGSLQKEKAIHNLTDAKPFDKSADIVANVLSNPDKSNATLRGLLESPYLDEWILFLQQRGEFFSPQKNIKPCVQTEEQTWRSASWRELNLLETYCEKGVSNEEVDRLVLKLLRESISVYELDRASSPYEQLNSSYAILNSLLRIALSKTAFVNQAPITSLVKIHFSSPTLHPFHLAYALYQALGVLLESDQQVVFDAYKAIADADLEDDGYEKYMVAEPLIQKNPSAYYSYALKRIKDDFLGLQFYDLGAFYEYEKSYLERKTILPFRWLKAASKGIDASDLKRDVLEFIHSDNPLFKKIGLCLININFEKAADLFYENLSLFYSDADYYADLRCLLERRGMQVFGSAKQQDLISAWEGATFGQQNGKLLSLLKNHLALIYKQNGMVVPAREETASEKERVLNFDKSIYVINHNDAEDKQAIYNRIARLSINEAVSAFAEIQKGSEYFGSVVDEAFRDYLFQRFPDEYVDHFCQFGPDFATSMLMTLVQNDPIEPQTTKKAIQAVIDYMNDKEEFLSCLPAVFYSTERISSLLSSEELLEILQRIRLDWMALEEFESSEKIIDVCINERLFSYFNLLVRVLTLEQGLLYAKGVVTYYRGHHSCRKLKPLLAYLYPSLFFVDREYTHSMTDYVFGNVLDGKNPSYLMLPLGRGLSKDLLNEIGNRADLKDHLSYTYGHSMEHESQAVLSCAFLGQFLFESRHERLVRIVFDCEQWRIILSHLKTINHWLATNQKTDVLLSRLPKYMRFLLALIEKSDMKTATDIDFIIGQVSKLILLSDDCDDICWEVLIGLFGGFKGFLADESVELIRKYQDERVSEIAKLLDSYFRSYDQLLFYETTVVEVFNLAASNSKYRQFIRGWRVLLVSKNTALDTKLRH